MAKNILKQWARKGVTPAQVHSWYYAHTLMTSNIGPQMQAILKRYGLEDLSNWAAESIIQGKSAEQIENELFDQPAFKQRFPAITQREQKGLPPISIDDYLSYEETASSLGSTWGLNLSKQEVDDLISHDVSPVELEERFNIAAGAVYESDIETRSELARLFNITQGDLMRYWMDPKKELGDLQQRYRMGQVAGAAIRSGYGTIQKTSAQRLAEVGMTREDAVTGFGQLAHMAGVFTPIDRAEALLDEQEQIELLAGNADVQSEVERRVLKRVNRFAGQTAYGVGREGFTTGAAS